MRYNIYTEGHHFGGGSAFSLYGEGNIFTLLRLKAEGVMYMVTWELLFQLCLVILAILTFFILSVEFIIKIILYIINKK